LEALSEKLSSKLLVLLRISHEKFYHDISPSEAKIFLRTLNNTRSTLKTYMKKEFLPIKYDVPLNPKRMLPNFSPKITQGKSHTVANSADQDQPPRRERRTLEDDKHLRLVEGEKIHKTEPKLDEEAGAFVAPNNKASNLVLPSCGVQNPNLLSENSDLTRKRERPIKGFIFASKNPEDSKHPGEKNCISMEADPKERANIMFKAIQTDKKLQFMTKEMIEKHLRKKISMKDFRKFILPTGEILGAFEPILTWSKVPLNSLYIFVRSFVFILLALRI